MLEIWPFHYHDWLVAMPIVGILMFDRPGRELTLYGSLEHRFVAVSTSSMGTSHPIILDIGERLEYLLAGQWDCSQSGRLDPIQ